MKISDNEGNISSDFSLVLNKWKIEFSNLLNQEPQTNIFNTIGGPILNNGTFNDFLLTDPITFYETVNVINKAKNGKAAGFDNLPSVLIKLSLVSCI